MRIHHHLVLACGLALAGCIPDVEEADTLVAAPRVLAVRATPAEASRREQVAFEALYVDANGTLDAVELDWAFCLDRKPLAELGPISPTCLAPEGDALAPLGAGPSVSGQVPMDACRLFGPDRPPPKDGEPAGRPVDPDPTGGYYQPLRLFDAAEDRYAIFELRVSCNLPAVTQQQFVEWNRRYRRNENPELESLVIVEPGDDFELVPDDVDAAVRVAPGETLELRASWPECESGEACGDGLCATDEDIDSCPEDCTAPAPVGCAGAEPYLYFDLATREFAMRREGMRLSWFATAGRFREPRTGRTESEADERTSDNAWTAPEKTGDVTLWVVLRDERGGTSWRSYAVRVER